MSPGGAIKKKIIIICVQQIIIYALKLICVHDFVIYVFNCIICAHNLLIHALKLIPDYIFCLLFSCRDKIKHLKR